MSSTSYEYTSTRFKKTLFVAAGCLLLSFSQLRSPESKIREQGGSLVEKVEHQNRVHEEEERSTSPNDDEVHNATFDSSNGLRNATSDESKSPNKVQDTKIEKPTFLDFLELEHPECISKSEKIELGKYLHSFTIMEKFCDAAVFVF